MTALLIARFHGDPERLLEAYDRVHQVVMNHPGPPFGELRHHCAVGHDGLYLVGVWQSEAHITARFSDPTFRRLLQSADFPPPDDAQLTILRLHAILPPLGQPSPAATSVEKETNENVREPVLEPLQWPAGVMDKP